MATKDATRRTAADVDKLVPKFKAALKRGDTMKSIKAEHGFSDDGPIRAALARAGFDSKGKPLTVESISGSGATLAKRLIKERATGTPWYILSIATGKPEPELRKLVADNGGETKRVYRQSEKSAAKAATKSKTNGGKPAAKAKAPAKAKAKVTVKVRKATKEDPSSQA